jgi:hypothetical protein
MIFLLPMQREGRIVYKKWRKYYGLPSGVSKGKWEIGKRGKQHSEFCSSPFFLFSYFPNYTFYSANVQVISGIDIPNQSIGSKMPLKRRHNRETDVEEIKAESGL